MTDTTTTTTTPAAAQAAADKARAEALDLVSSCKGFWQDASEGAPHLAAAIQAAQLLSVPILANFDLAAGDIREGYGVGLLPVSVKEEGRQQLSKLVVCQLPTLETFTASALAWVQEAVAEACFRKLRNEAAKDASAGLSVEVEHFTESRKVAIKAAFIDFLKQTDNAFVVKLESKGFAGLNRKKLEECLASSAMAAVTYPKVRAGVWLQVLDALEDDMAAAKDSNGRPFSTAIVEHWRTTRDAEASTADVEILDLEGL